MSTTAPLSEPVMAARALDWTDGASPGTAGPAGFGRVGPAWGGVGPGAGAPLGVRACTTVGVTVVVVLTDDCASQPGTMGETAVRFGAKLGRAPAETLAPRSPPTVAPHPATAKPSATIPTVTARLIRFGGA